MCGYACLAGTAIAVVFYLLSHNSTGPQNWNFPYGATAEKTGRTCVHQKKYVRTPHRSRR